MRASWWRINWRLTVAVGIITTLLVAATCNGEVGPAPGNLEVAVSGLPSGAEANVTVTGPGGFSQILSSSQTLTGLTPGVYTVIADDAEHDGDIYIASVTGSPATVTEGDTASVSVDYALEEAAFDPGTLEVAVTGLASTAEADVSVTGPNGFSEQVTATTTFTGLVAGAYAVTANDVTVEGIIYNAAVTGSPANVPEGGTATVTVTYTQGEVTPGSLQVSVSGLPSEADADVTVTGPEGFSETLTESTTLENLLPGEYLVTAEDVTHDDDTYAAAVSGSPATVPPGGSASAEVAYTFLDPGEVGTLDVTIEGLESGVDADVTVNGPGGFVQHLTESATLTGLAPGNYEVTAQAVSVEDATFMPVVTGSPSLVLPEETEAVDVQYVQYAEDDNDAASNPGLHVRLRGPTSPAYWVDRALFNGSDPIVARAIQYRKETSNPGNRRDWLAFDLVGTSSGTRSFDVRLECSEENEESSPIRVEIRDQSGNRVGSAVSCGQSRRITVAVPGEFLAEVGQRPTDDNLFYTEYRLYIENTCPPSGCTYQPYE